MDSSVLQTAGGLSNRRITR
uniref:Uncharacterized protein n=1 Tax=Arundo donax TaxID=35708 RepID=A0A0A9C2S9_ARUDO